MSEFFFLKVLILLTIRGQAILPRPKGYLERRPAREVGLVATIYIYPLQAHRCLRGTAPVSSRSQHGWFMERIQDQRTARRCRDKLVAQRTDRRPG